MIVNNASLVTHWTSQPAISGALVAIEGKSIVDFGLVGKLVDPVEGRHARIEIAPGVKVTILRSSIAGLDAEETTKTKDEPALAEKK